MSYEPGSPQCRLLIEAKENLLSAMKAIASLKNMDSIQNDLLKIYNQLEDMHELRRGEESGLIAKQE